MTSDFQSSGEEPEIKILLIIKERKKSLEVELELTMIEYGIRYTRRWIFKMTNGDEKLVYRERKFKITDRIL